jgi:hypothetical protein
MADQSTSGWAALVAEATARHGAFHLRLCERFDVAPLTVRNRARREQWDRPYRGVVCLPGSADSWWRRASSRLEAVGSDAALTGMAAAYAHSMIRPRTGHDRDHPSRWQVPAHVAARRRADLPKPAR